MLDSFIQDLPFFNPAQRALAEEIEAFAAREIAPLSGEAVNVEMQYQALLARIAGGNWLVYAVALTPEQKLDLRAICIIRETLAYHSALADLAFVMQGLGTYPIARAAPEHVREFWLTRAVVGKAVAAFALTEPGAGSDAAALQTAAVREGEMYVLNGRKRFISNTGIADFYTVFARTGARADGRAEISAFVVGAKLPGFQVREQYDMLAPHPIGEVELIDCRVPAADMLGAPGDGYKLAMATLDMFRTSVGAAACGMARRALEAALNYAQKREQFGKPLAAQQLIQAKLAEMSTELDAARLLVYRAAYLKDAGVENATRYIAQAKMYATETAQKIIDDALQIHGGVGLIRGQIVERLYRDIRALRIYEGTTEIQKLIIANQLLQEN